MKKVKCPNCGEDSRVYFKLHWSEKFNDFACGKCRLEMKIPKKFIGDPNSVIKATYEFKYLEEIEEVKNKVDNMTEEEMIERLKELEKKNN